MPKAESSDAYLDRVMALAASQARVGTANHAAAANHGGINTADQTRAVTANRAGVGIQAQIPPAPEAFHPIDQFGPPPLVDRHSPSSERKAKPDRRGGERGGRAVIAIWLQAFSLLRASPGRSRMRLRSRSFLNQNPPPRRQYETRRRRHRSNNNNKRCR